MKGFLVSRFLKNLSCLFYFLLSFVANNALASTTMDLSGAEKFPEVVINSTKNPLCCFSVKASKVTNMTYCKDIFNPVEIAGIYDFKGNQIIKCVLSASEAPSSVFSNNYFIDQELIGLVKNSKALFGDQEVYNILEKAVQNSSVEHRGQILAFLLLAKKNSTSLFPMINSNPPKLYNLATPAPYYLPFCFKEGDKEIVDALARSFYSHRNSAIMISNPARYLTTQDGTAFLMGVPVVNEKPVFNPKGPEIIDLDQARKLLTSMQYIEISIILPWYTDQEALNGYKENNRIIFDYGSADEESALEFKLFSPFASGLEWKLEVYDTKNSSRVFERDIIFNELIKWQYDKDKKDDKYITLGEIKGLSLKTPLVSVADKMVPDIRISLSKTTNTAPEMKITKGGSIEVQKFVDATITEDGAVKLHYDNLQGERVEKTVYQIVPVNLLTNLLEENKPQVKAPDPNSQVLAAGYNIQPQQRANFGRRP